MKGTRIINTSKAKGVFEDVYVSGTPVPGTCMELKPSTAAIAGVFTYQPAGTEAASSGNYMSADGDKKCIAVLLERDQDAGIYSDAYVSGEMGRIYYPVAGEKMNMAIGDQSGTDDDYIIGTELMIDNSTDIGKLMPADSDAEVHPFTCLETSTDTAADFVAWCRYNGSGGA